MKNKLLRVLILFLAFIGLFFFSDQVFLMNDEEYDPFTPINQITEDDGVDFPVDI